MSGRLQQLRYPFSLQARRASQKLARDLGVLVDLLDDPDNYYIIDEKFYLIDLPGYGYAKTSQKERAYWGKLVLGFILKSENIQLAFHIIDGRHKPTDLDVKLHELLRSVDIPQIILLNKADKLKQYEYRNAIENIKTIFPEFIKSENLFFYSSFKATGRKEIVSRLNNLFYLS